MNTITLTDLHEDLEAALIGLDTLRTLTNRKLGPDHELLEMVLDGLHFRLDTALGRFRNGLQS